MKNIATVLVGSALILGLSFAFVTPAKADLLSDLQAQVQALLAQIAALQGGSTTTTGAGCYAFTMTHQQGDSGGEVMWIQQFLNSHGAQVAASGAGSPGNETAYFGALTKAAVAKWQAANGVMPAAGYWGPITRAKVAQVCAGSTPTTPTNPTNPTSPAGLNGTAGSITQTQTSADVEDEVFTSETEKVLGFDVEASGGDVRVTNVRVKFTAAVDSAASDRLSDYASEISIWADDQKIASMSPSDFVRDSAGVYSASIPVSQVVRMGSANEVAFYVGFTAVSSIDSDNDGSTNDWTVQLLQTRYVDPTGVTLFDTPSSTISNAGVYVTRISSSSDVTLRMGEGSGNPKAGNIEVDESGSTDVVLAEFTLKAEGTAMEFDTLKATSTVTGVGTTSVIVQEFYLMRGSTQLDEFTPTTDSATQAITFSLDDTEEIAKDATQTYRIVAKVNAIGDGSGDGVAFDQGDSITVAVRPDVWNIDADATVDGKSVTDRAGSVTTYAQTLFSEGIMTVKVGENVSVSNSDTVGNSYGTFKSTLRITAFGSNDVYIPLNASSTSAFSTTADGGVQYAVLDSTGAVASTASTTATVTRISGGSIVTVGGVDLLKIGGGASADVEINVSYNPIIGVTGGQFRTQVWGIGHRANSTASPATTRVATTPVDEYRTSYSATVNN